MLHKDILLPKLFYGICLLIPVSFYLPQIVNSILLGLLSLLTLIRGFRKKSCFPKNQYFLLFFLLYYVCLVIGLLYTGNLKQGFFELEKRLAFALLPLIFFFSDWLTRTKFRNIIFTFIISTCVAITYCLIYAIIENYLFGYNLFHDIRYNINYQIQWHEHGVYLPYIINMTHVFMGMYIVFAIYGLVYYSVTAKKQSLVFRLLQLCLFFYFFYFLLLIGAKMAIINLVLAFLVSLLYWIFHFQGRKYRIAFILVFFVVGIVLTSVVVRQHRFQELIHYIYHPEDLKEIHPDNSITARYVILNCSLESIRNNIWWGVGTGDLNDTMNAFYRSKGYDVWADRNYHSHNQFLDSWLMWGLPGLLVFSSMLLIPLYISIRKKYYFYSLFLILIIMSCMTDSVLSGIHGIMFYTFFNALIAFSD